jgi:hypothetical protein
LKARAPGQPQPFVVGAQAGAPLPPPTDVAIAPNGDIFVGDGHSGGGTSTGNARTISPLRT